LVSKGLEVPFGVIVDANTDFLKATLWLTQKRVPRALRVAKLLLPFNGILKINLIPSPSFPTILKSTSNFPSYKKDEFASSSRLIPMLPLPALAKLPLHNSESFSETPQGEFDSAFQLHQIPVVHSKKCPNYSSPPQIRDEVFF
jgi:hypothetical protein